MASIEDFVVSMRVDTSEMRGIILRVDRKMREIHDLLLELEQTKIKFECVEKKEGE